MAKTLSCDELKQRIRELEKEKAEWLRAEEALREKEWRYRAIFDHTYQFIGLMTPDGMLLEANKTALAFSGIDESDVFGKPFWETPWWAHSKELQERLREAVKTAAGGRFVRFEATHTAAGGALRYIDFSLTPVKDETGRVVLLIPEGRDITDRKLAEHALIQSENTARALLNAPTDNFLLIDSKGVILAANKVAAASLHKSVDEVVGKTFLDLIPARIAQSRMMRVQQVVESKRPVRFEDSNKGRAYDHNMYPILSAGGEVAEIAIYVRDVTDYKQAVARLEERTADLLNSEEKYRTLVENIPIVVYRISPTGETVFVNRVMEDMFGYRTGEIIGPPDLWYEKVYPDDRPRVEELRRRSFQEGKEFVAEYRVTHKDGYTVYVMDHAIPVHLANGLIGSVDGFIMDMTGMVRLQERLLGEGEIKTISEVSASLAHEIRNPLVSVGGFARRLFSSMSPGDPNRTKVEIIVKEASRMETILRMMLSYIQPLDLHMSLMDPNSLIKTVLDNLDSRILERKVKVGLQLAPGTSQIYVDRPRMERALETLIKNALSQMPEGGGTLSVAVSKEGRNCNLIIRYPVISMSADDVEHFFYPFTWTRMISEIVDLPLSKILVDKLGGSIEVSLNQPEELTLRVSLPC
jgi:PAS domain S-box-containing protein